MANVKKVFNFLKDFNNMRNPVTTEVQKQNWYYDIGDLPNIEELWSIYHEEDYESLKILEVVRPILNPCPSPDETFKKWLHESWDEIEVETVDFIKSKTEKTRSKDGEIIEVIENFKDNEDRVRDSEEWLEKRKEWRKDELPRKQVLDLYNDLYKLYSDMKREGEGVELVLGDGLINWSTTERKINHPVLLQKVELEFNTDKPSFIIKCEEVRTELYTSMLRVIDTINQSMLGEVIQEVENKGFHISDKINNIEVFKRIINVVDENGKYIEDINNNSKGPTITYKPTLFLRKRNLGYTEFINRIIEDLDTQENIKLPDFFETMVGNYNEDEIDDENNIVGESWNVSGIDNEILLTLPANSEQLRIVQYLDRYGSVLVQGPPGTGKTHTIANLIGHLLSKGNSVLVTSHTEKALSVLKEKVFEELQSLCLSLLSSSSERKEMDKALFTIAEKNTMLDLDRSLQKIDRLEAERKKLVGEYKLKQQELVSVRSLEYQDIIFGNTSITPIKAAKFIKDGYGTIDYIPGKTNDDTVLLPLSLSDLSLLYETNSLTNNEEELLSRKLPDINDVWDKNKFKKLNKNLIKNEEEIKGWVPELIFKNNISQTILNNLLEESLKVKESMDNMEEFQKRIINQSILDGMYIKFWEDIFNDTEELMGEYESYRKILFENDFDILLDYNNKENMDLLDQIINNGKEIPVNLITGIIKPKWKKIQTSITNKNKPIEKKSEYENARTIIKYEIHKNKILNKISKLLADISISIDLEDYDTKNKLENFLNKVKVAIYWHEKSWVSLIDNTQNYIDDLEKYKAKCSIGIDNPLGDMDRLINDLFIYDINKSKYSLLVKEMTEELDQYATFLDNYKDAGDLFRRLKDAFINKETDEYGNIYDQLVEVCSKSEVYRTREKLLEQLKLTAPQWADEVQRKKGIHGKSYVPDDVEEAWKWRQLNNQIDRINSYDPNVIQKELGEINKKIMNNTRELAHERAWFNQVKKSRQNKAQTQAIESWRQTMRQIGKGTGKNAPRLREKARRLMPDCQGAIPVWIMPLNRVADNFDPQRNKFDVVIIDEASQADILALSALYLGKKVIIVGDDEQVSPSSIGVKAAEVHALISQHLNDIPRNHLFNESTSIYDMAKTSGFKPLMLAEHFRCLPEIIEFSNQLSYNGQIKPLRDASNVNINPPVVEYRVSDGYRDNKKVNPVEAEHIASLICACIEDEAYKDKTIGVISLVGTDQAYEIDRLLQSNLDPREYESRRIQCGNSAQFQGDERDIIFLSMVDEPKEGGGPLRLVSESGNNDRNRKIYNVAASRAKDQLWVVHSLNPEIDLQPNDIRLRLIKHAINPAIDKHDDKLSKAESDFEIRVMKDLLNKGYDVEPQWIVGAYRIDMVVKYGDKRIALECDGERWHTQDDLTDDLNRQAILERLGWTFIRIRGSEYYRNPQETMEWVFNELGQYGIKPNFELDKNSSISTNNELTDRIKTRAYQIRMDWNGEEVVDKVEQEVR